jgi:DNA-binding NarL/FixJ family response regulator
MTDLENCVLIVEDEFFIAESLRMHLEDMGVEVCGIAATADDAVMLAQEHRPRLILMDMRLRGDGDGVDAALAIHATVGSQILFVTGSQEPRTVQRIQLDHPIGVLFKPFSGWALRAAVQAALADGGVGVMQTVRPDA